MTTNTLEEYLEDVVYYMIQEIQQQDDNDEEEIDQEIYAFRDDNILDDNKIYNGIFTNYIIN
jgi:hypothetical protein